MNCRVSDEKAYLIGGMGLDTNPKDQFVSYNVEINKFEKHPNMPTPRYASFSFLIDDQLYVLGRHSS